MSSLHKRILSVVLVCAISLGIVGLYVSGLVMAANLGSYTAVYDSSTVSWITSYGLPVSVQGALTSQGISIRSSNTSNYSVDGNSGFMCISAGRESPNGTGGTVYRCVNTAVYDNSSDSRDSAHNTLKALSGLTYSQIVYGCYSLGRNGGSSWAYAHAILSYLIGDDATWFGPLASSNAYSALTTFAAAAASAGMGSSSSAEFYVFMSNSGRQNLIALNYTPPADTGKVVIRKIDQNNNPVVGASISLTCVSGADVSSLSVNVPFSSITNGVQFNTSGSEITVTGLQPNSDYVIHEISVPDSNYSFASDIAFRTDSRGNAPGDSGNYTYTMVDQYASISGEISFNKVDGAGNESDEVRTAVIEFTAAPNNTVSDAMTGLAFTDNTGTAGYDQTGESNNGIPRILFTASAVGTDITIRNLKPGASYVFHEVSVPDGYIRSDDIVVNVLADGSTQVNGQLVGNVIMYNQVERRSMMGSIAIYKQFDSADPFEEQRFWANASSVSFNFYHFAADWETTKRVIDSGYWPFVTYGRLNRGDNEAFVFWSADESYRTYEWYTDSAYSWWPGRWWSIWSQVHGRANEHEWVGAMTSLPVGYYMVTEEWQEGRFLTSSEEQVWIDTLNASGWHDVSDGSYRRYAQIFYVQESMTYTVDWDGNITGQLTEGSMYWSDYPENNNPIFNYHLNNRVTNIQNTGSVDLEKIDMTGTGVDGLSFELWRGASRYAVGHISTTESSYVNADGYNVYPIDWNYSTQYCTDKLNRDQAWAWQTIDWTNRQVVGSLNYGTYQLREIVPDGRTYRTPDGWNAMDSDGDGDTDYFYRDVEITQDYQSSPLQVSVANREYRLRIEVTKKDLWTGEIISGFAGDSVTSFSLYVDRNNNGIVDVSDELVGTSSDADRDGTVVFEYSLNDLFPGVDPQNYPVNYLIQETVAPYNYYVNSTVVAVNASEANGFTNSVVVEDSPYSVQIRIYKYDADTNDVISTAAFTVFNDTDGNGSYTPGIDTVASTYYEGSMADALVVWNASEGCYITSPLRSGDYIVVETGLPEGYFYVDSEGQPSLTANEAFFRIESRDTSVSGFTADLYEAQIYNIRPEIHTTLTNASTGSHVASVGEQVELVDVVSYSNLVPGEEYVLTGTLMDKHTGTPLTDGNGQSIVSQTSFTADSSSGSVEVVFVVDTQRLMDDVDAGIMEAPIDIVAFEDLDLASGRDVAVHEDINDEGQTVRIGEIHTGAIDADTNTKLTSYGLATIIDYVHYEGLEPGREYTMSGTMHLVDYSADGSRIDVGVIGAGSSDEVLNPVTVFTPESSQGVVEVVFVVDTRRFAGRTMVCFEDLYENGQHLMWHADINDEDQSVYVPSVRTNAYGADVMGGVVAYDTRARITDTVYYENLIPGMEYTVSGSLYWVYEDENGYVHSGAVASVLGNIQGISSRTFTATDVNGSVDIEFVLDSTVLSDLNYDKLVVIEDLMCNGVVIARHSDLNDEGQTVYLPQMHTTAVDEITGGKIISEVVDAVIVDHIYYTNLQPGREYTVVGAVQYVITDDNGNITSTGTLIQNGAEVRSQLTFVPSDSSGYVDVPFEVNGLELSGIDKLVVFEDMYAGPGVRIATHADLNDEGQTIEICELSSSARGTAGGRSIAPENNVVIVDTVFFEGLVPGREYRIETDVMNSYTRQSDAHCSTVFTPESSDGSIDISVRFDGRGYTNEKLVVFECVYDNSTGVLVKSHMDWNEKSQTITFVPQTGLKYDPSYRYMGYVMLSSCVGLASAEVVSCKKRKRKRLV